MEYARIIAELDKTTWMITGEALDGIYKVVNMGLSDNDRYLFHKADIGAFSALNPSEGRKKAVKRGSTGFMFIDGPIVPRDNAFANVSDLTSVQTLTRDFEAFTADSTIKDIVFLIDSPGGAVTGVSEFSQLVAKSDKATTAFVVGHAASAAFWIASAADKIISVNTGFVGSIGVVLRRVLDGNNAKIQEFKSTQSPDKNPDLDTKAGKAIMQEQVDGLADVMIDFIAGQRNVESNFVIDKFGKGGVLIASKAKDVGMIDAVMTLDDFVGQLSVGNNTDIQACEKLPVIKEQNKQQGSKQLTTPANAGNGEQQMTLKEFLAENPAATAEVEKLKQEALDAGTKSIAAKTEKLAPFMDPNGDYPKAIQALAMESMKGGISVDSVRAAAAVIDGLKEEKKSEVAKEESKEIKETPARIEAKSTDGELKTEADVMTAWNEMLAFEGKEQIDG